MNKIQSVFIIALVAIVPVISFAQNNTNSPYTRYGYGNLSDQSFAGQRGMGGIGYGLRNSLTINSMNPASFSNIDSMTFLFDMGLSAQLSWYKDGNNNSSKVNGNIEYVAMQFPLYKHLGMGLGFKPISYVGYSYGDTMNIPTTGTIAQNIYSGTGGLNQLYGALSYNLFQRLSLGVNVAYLFGDVRHDRLVSFSTSSAYQNDLADTLRTSGFTYDFGFQYIQPLGKNRRLVIGGVYTPKIKIKGKVMEGETVFEPLTSGYVNIISYEGVTSYDQGFDMPESYAAGFTYNQLNKLTVGADFLYQKWADAQFYSKKDSLADRMKINVGGEFIPDVASRNFFRRVRYRAGAYMTDSYIKVKDSGYKEYGASLGLGLPMNDKRSFLNLAFEYSVIRPEINTLIDEQYFKITVSYTFNELWFFKRKVQ